MKNKNNLNLFNVYSEKMPDILKDFINTETFSRLKEIGMHCGCEYTSFRSFSYIKDYTRWEHSIGVALIVWKFTNDKKQSVAGLLHDISTPAFSHTIDFLNNDYEKQESTEEDTRKMIESSDEFQQLMKKYDITIDEIDDYHIYPIADNDSPMLSADRLEYHMGNFLCRGLLSLEEIKEIYDDLYVAKNENDIDELVFKNIDKAKKFTHLLLSNSRLFVSDEDRFSMQYLAEILKKAIKEKIIVYDDLYTTEPDVIEKIKANEQLRVMWEKYCSFNKMIFSDVKTEADISFNVSAKKRYIDPLVSINGELKRISSASKEVNEDIEDFLNISFDKWISAE